MRLRGLILGGALLMSAGAANAASSTPNPVAWLLEAAVTKGPGEPVNLVAVQVFNNGPGQAQECKKSAKMINAAGLGAFQCPDNADCSVPIFDEQYYAASCVKIFEAGSN